MPLTDSIDSAVAAVRSLAGNGQRAVIASAPVAEVNFRADYHLWDNGSVEPLPGDAFFVEISKDGSTVVWLRDVAGTALLSAHDIESGSTTRSAEAVPTVASSSQMTDLA